MALQLMEPVYNELPFFQANQVLTVEHLNDLTGYLSQQERYTRNKLIGSGIVCGLSFNWDNTIPTHVEVTIDDGCAITSAGYLIVYKQPVQVLNHKRNFQRLHLYPPFNDPSVPDNHVIYELITKAEFDSEKVVPKSILIDANRNNRALILLLEPEVKSPAKCLDENCDDKGKVYLYTIRPLLVPLTVLDAIIDAPASKDFFTEEGRGAKAKASILSGLDFIRLANLFKNNNIQNINNHQDLINLFKAPCQNVDLNIIKTQIDALITAFPWIFDIQSECMDSEIASLAASATLGTLFRDIAQTFRDDPANINYIQYLYDFIRDVVDAYNELFTSVTDMVGECGGNEFIHPHHVMLGRPTTNDTLACYHEEKYNEVNFRYRHYFVPSPVMDGQFMLYENVQSLFKRLVRIIAHFKINMADTEIKVTPSKDYDRSLGERAIPYFYLKSATESIKSVWKYEATRRNKISRIKGYQLNSQTVLLDEDTSKNDFFRIEGHIGTTSSSSLAAINLLRNAYNLPFTVTSVSIKPKSNNTHCAFPDLEEEYNYYRDRVLGYLREILRWLDSVKDSFGKSPELKTFYERFLNAILKLREILSARCIRDFDYNSYKSWYAEIWNAIFELYIQSISSNTSNANQSLNSLLNVLNIIFFRPVYKIWYMYKYRIVVMGQNQITSLKLLATGTTGLEHLAGARRGETFLLVSDPDQGDKVVADFNLPDLLGCSCDCKAAPCDRKHFSLVSPLQKPIIMVVDYSFTTENAFIKSKAFFDSANNLYFLELDSMGFYKADSTIQPKVQLTDEKGLPFTELAASWENEKLVLRYKMNKDMKRDRIYKIYYELSGDFDEGKVKGIIYLIVIGRLQSKPDAEVDVTVGNKTVRAYPYDKVVMKKVRPEMKFDGEFKKRTIGGEKVNVYTTRNGNLFGIFKDSAGLSYVKVIAANTPAVEEIPFILEAGGNSSKGTVKINVIDKRDKLTSTAISGVIKNEEGLPLKDVRLRTSADKEVLTNEKGEYTFTGLKAGEAITIERHGYKTTNLQVNSKLNPDVNLEKEPLFNIKGLEDINLPGNLGSLVSGVNLAALRNLMK